MKSRVHGPLVAAAICFVTGCAASAEPAASAGGDVLEVSRDRLAGEGIRLVEVREEELPQTVSGAGRVAFDDQHVQHVLSPVSGQVTRVLAHLGQKVKPGTPLVALLSPDVGSARADVVKAEADLAQAAAELDRQRQLAKLGAGPQRDLEAAQDAHRRAQAELARARQKAALFTSADLDAVSQELTVRSAMGGEVIARAVSPGMQLQGTYSGGAPAELFTIGDIDRVWVIADVSEQDLRRISPGAEAAVRVTAWPDRVFAGKIDWVAQALDPALRTGRVRIAVPNGDHALRPEMLAQVSIVTGARRALVVPRQAVMPLEGQAFVWVAAGEKDGGRIRFTRRRVELSGAPEAPLAVVQDGLSAGERVLVEQRARESAAGEVRVTRTQVERSGIRLEPVGQRGVGQAVTAGARIAFDDSKVAHLFSPVTGRVRRVLADLGQRVKKGAPLVVLASPDVGSAFSDAAKAEADAIAAEHELRRQQELVAAHAGARKDLEAAEAGWRKAKAELDRARQKTRLLSAGTWDAVTQELTLRSPIDGEVVARAAAPGMELQGQWSGAGAPVELFTIGADDPLWVIGDVYEMDLESVRLGQEVTVRDPALPDHAFQGRIDWIASVVDPATRTVKIRCVVENPGHLLRPEMAPVLSIALPAGRQLAVPRSAVLRLGDEDVVFVAAGTAPDGQLAFKRQKVTVGDDRSDGTVPILAGLAPGDKLVVSGGIFLVGLL